MKKILKILGAVTLVLLVLSLIFTAATYIFHSIKTNQELELLREEGYYNPVSVGDYSLNVAKFGNENGKHTIVGLAGLGMGDYAVTARQMTAPLEEDNLVVFVDRAGYGFSDDTDKDMTLELIVEDYRKALKNAGIEGPYILMPHSIGGAYANYWASNYPEEIEGIVFVDGSQLSEDAFVEEADGKVGFVDRALAFLSGIGFGRYVIREYCYLYPDNYTAKDQTLGDGLSLLTLDSIAPISESYLLQQNAIDAFRGIITNDIPKMYICASWGFSTVDEITEYNKWVNRQIEINDIDSPGFPTEYEGNEELLDDLLNAYKEAQREIIYPYAEKMGNCQVVLLPGDHMIYQQRPDDCGRLILEFIDQLDK